MEGQDYEKRSLWIEQPVYHVFNRSIAEFKIFNTDSEFSRIKDSVLYYRQEKPAIKFSRFIKIGEKTKRRYSDKTVLFSDNNKKLVEIIAYCFMPTHLHLILKETKEKGISIFMNNALNSYTRYFNTKHNRKGPLWQARSKRVLVKSDEQLLHLTRYIHLNPVTAYLVDKPDDWQASSYKEYLNSNSNRICKYEDILDIEPISYRKFVNDRIDYQRELAKIKDLILE